MAIFVSEAPMRWGVALWLACAGPGWAEEPAPTPAPAPDTEPDPALTQWIQEIQRLVVANFRPKGDLRLACTVTLWVDPVTGQVTARAVTLPSGSTVFDAAALAAVDATGPLPPPPEKYRALAEKGMILKFVAPPPRQSPKRG
jgi:TonB family protein